METNTPLQLARVAGGKSLHRSEESVSDCMIVLNLKEA